MEPHAMAFNGTTVTQSQKIRRHTHQPMPNKPPLSVTASGIPTADLNEYLEIQDGGIQQNREGSLDSPVIIQEMFHICDVGVSSSIIGKYTVRLDTEGFVTVRNNCWNVCHSIIVCYPSNRKICYEAQTAIVNPDGKFVAVTVLRMLRIYHIDGQSLLKEVDLKFNIKFLKWIGPISLAIISQRKVYHFAISDSPEFAFKKSVRLYGLEVKNYSIDDGHRWLFLSTLCDEAHNFAGLSEVFDTKSKLSTIIEADVGCFTTVNDFTHLCYIGGVRKHRMLKVWNLEQCEEMKSSNAVKSVPYLMKDEKYDDSPLGVRISQNVMYVMSQNGLLTIYDVCSLVCIFSEQVCCASIIKCCDWSSYDGIIWITRMGKVFTARVNESTIVAYLNAQDHSADKTLQVVGRNRWPGGKDLFIRTFYSEFSDGHYTKAAEIAKNAPVECYPVPKILQTHSSEDLGMLFHFIDCIMKNQEASEKERKKQNVVKHRQKRTRNMFSDDEDISCALSRPSSRKNIRLSSQEKSRRNKITAKRIVHRKKL